MLKALQYKSNSVLSWPPVAMEMIDNKFKCPSCNKLYVNVHQADDCGCRFCLDCLDNIVKQEDRTCPVCKYKLASEFKIPDKYYQRKIENIKIKCNHSGCTWEGNLISYRNHYNSHFNFK